MKSDDFFDEIKEYVADGAERWKKIDQYYNTLKYLLESGKYTPENLSTGMMTLRLVLLLVDHIRPMGGSAEQLKTLQNDIEGMLTSLLGGQK